MMVTITEADAYFNDRLHSDAWFENTISDRNKALVQANKLVNNLNFKGDVSVAGQIDAFPRSLSIPSYDTRGQICYTLTVIETPQAIKEAVFESAYALINGFDIEKELRGVGVVSEGFSSVRTSYDATFVQPYIRAGIPSGVAWNLLQPYLERVNNLRIERV